ncbi:MAG: DNA-3-methyladenine glycosylase [Burkholderia plantarii]|nr:MAG: DNA-3-methyladenine glycosylase [Burkholderia plantarii]
MATGRKVPARRAATAATPAVKRTPGAKAAASRAEAGVGAANGVVHKPAARGAAKPARVDAQPGAESRELAADVADSGAGRVRATEAAVPEQLAAADTVVRPQYWDKACADLMKRDRILKKLIPKFGPAHLVKRGDPFVTLARSVVGQQISVASAQAVWAAIVAACPKLTPQQVIRLGPEKLAACGLSKRKSEYILDLAQHFVSGALHVDTWTSMDDEAVIGELTQIRGIGRWTAEMFLIFNLSRPDVLPLDDLGLIRAISVNYFSGEPVTRSEAREVAANWEPWRTVATWYMWRSLDPRSNES